jgi:hypothetical protein
MSSLASRASFRIRITWTRAADGEWRYTFGDWVREDMLVARSGGDATLLPNGDVVLTNGGQVRCAACTITTARIS